MFLHPPRPVADLLQGSPVVAHRGWSAAAPENTLAAFERAAELGVMIELDVCLAATGEVMVIHDDHLDRTTNGSGAVAETPFETLQSLDAGSWFSDEFAGEPIPTLGDVLAAVDGRVAIDIELKTTPHKAPLANAVVDVVREAGQVDQVFVSSFDPLLLAHVRKAEPAIRRGQLVGSFAGVDMALYQKWLLQKMALNYWSRPDLVIGSDDFVTEAWVQKKRRRGYGVMVYTVNDPARMQELLRWGVDAVITDAPDVGRNVLDTPPAREQRHEGEQAERRA